MPLSISTASGLGVLLGAPGAGGQAGTRARPWLTLPERCQEDPSRPDPRRAHHAAQRPTGLWDRRASAPLRAPAPAREWVVRNTWGACWAWGRWAGASPQEPPPEHLAGGGESAEGHPDFQAPSLPGAMGALSTHSDPRSDPVSRQRLKLLTLVSTEKGTTWPGHGEAGARTLRLLACVLRCGLSPSPQPSLEGPARPGCLRGLPSSSGAWMEAGAEPRGGSEQGPGWQGRAAMDTWRAEPGEAWAGPTAGGLGAGSSEADLGWEPRRLSLETVPQGCNGGALARPPEQHWMHVGAASWWSRGQGRRGCGGPGTTTQRG